VTDRSATSVLLEIASALPPVERAYAMARFLILRPKLLAVMDLLLPAEGRLLDVGCGFGLWTAYFSAMEPARRIVGLDRSARRVELARRVCAKTKAEASFVVGDVRDAAPEGPFAGAYVLDVLHHVPAADQVAVLEKLTAKLERGGVLVIKDITTEPRVGLAFTTVLDRAMVGFDEPLSYRHHDEWRRLLETMGFAVRVVRVPDVLPYPHVVLSATKRLDASSWRFAKSSFMP
jgi:2-polyprenyl-3-methyl-5-hydroxy-6-metoxy-1,4-benzoquinol methylase